MKREQYAEGKLEKFIFTISKKIKHPFFLNFYMKKMDKIASNIKEKDFYRAPQYL